MVEGHWIWRDSRGHGTSDLEASVEFAADGRNPVVSVLQLDMQDLKN